MEPKMGVWIDHRKAVIVDLTEKGPQTRTVLSGVEKQLRRTGDSPLAGRYEAQMVPADDSRQAALTGELNSYYDQVILTMRNACAIYICGPGEAKGELRSRIEQSPLSGRITAVETADTMTDSQIAARIVRHFQQADQGES